VNVGRRGTIQLVRVFGIRIGVSASWFLVLFFLIWVLEDYFHQVLQGSTTTADLIAALAALLFFTSIILHELGHALMARRLGIATNGIDLWFFGGISRLAREPATPGEEFKIAAAGPAVTAVIIVVCIVASVFASQLSGSFQTARFADGKVTPAAALLGWTWLMNLAILVFNLVPAFPLDGGRIARAIAWRQTGDRNRATRITAIVGQWFAYIVIGFGVFIAIRYKDPVDGVLFGVLGFFLWQAATSARAGSEVAERLEGVTVADLMDTQPVTIPGDMALLQVHDEFFQRYGWPWFYVIDDQRHFLGVLHSARVDGAIAAGQPVLPARELLDPGEESSLKVPLATPLQALVAAPGLRALGAMAVVDEEGRLAGVVTLDRVRRALFAGAGA
jgi:Zn-dependent protease